MVKKAPTAIICLSPNSGGMEINAIKLAKKLSPHTPIVMVAKADHFIANQHAEYVGFNGIQLETIKFRANLGMAIIRRAKEIVLKYGIKNVIFFGASELKSLHFSFIGLGINLTVIHSTTKNKPKKDWFHKLVYKNVNTHVAICKHLERNVAYIVPFGPKTQSRMIYSSLPVEAISYTPQNELTIVHTGRIAHGKGQIDAIKAVEILVKQDINFKLYLLGELDPRYKAEFETFLKTINYQEHLVFVGFTKEVKKYLAMADIFLFPSWGEGLSNSYIEALASNTPCLCYENTSFPELQDLGFHFIMSKDQDINDLQEKLLYIAHHLEKEKELSSNNFKVAQNIFSEEKEIASYLELLI